MFRRDEVTNRVRVVEINAGKPAMITIAQCAVLCKRMADKTILPCPVADRPRHYWRRYS